MEEDYESNFRHIPASDDILIECPQCRRDSDSVKIFHFPIIVYLFFFWMWFTKPIAACPSCQRLNIIMYAAINILSMHILWIFIIPL